MIEIDTVSKLVPLYLEHSGKLATLWNFQLAAFIGVIGWVFSHRKELQSHFYRIFLIIMVGSFGVYTWMSAQSATAHKQAVWEVLVENISTSPESATESEKICSTNEDVDMELSKLVGYICSLKPHRFREKSIAIIVGNIFAIIFIWFAPFVEYGRGIRYPEVKDK